MLLYSDRDLQQAGRRVRSCLLGMAAVLAPLLGLYALALMRQNVLLGALAALLGFGWALFMGDLRLAPRVRYLRFLKNLNSGLRRQTECEILCLEDGAEMQDGACVRALHVRLKDGDSRIFYLDASKAESLPAPGSGCVLLSCGRHVLGFSEN